MDKPFGRSAKLGTMSVTRREAGTAGSGLSALGYVGLPLVLLFSQEVFGVTGFDIAREVERLNAAILHSSHRPRTSRAPAKVFRATSASLDRQCRRPSICVPTPLSATTIRPMELHRATWIRIVGHLRPGATGGSSKSKHHLSPGTTEELIAPAIERAPVKVTRYAMLPDVVLGWPIRPTGKSRNTALTARDIPKVVGGWGN